MHFCKGMIVSSLSLSQGVVVLSSCDDVSHWKEAAEASQQAMLSVAGLDKDPTCGKTVGAKLIYLQLATSRFVI